MHLQDAVDGHDVGENGEEVGGRSVDVELGQRGVVPCVVEAIDCRREVVSVFFRQRRIHTPVAEKSDAPSGTRT